MTAWVVADFQARGPACEIERFRRLMFKTIRCPGRAGRRVYEVVFDFEAVVPLPRRLRGSRLGDRARASWGTAWNAQRLELVGETGEALDFRFLTVDRFPEPVFRALAAAFPRLVFEGTATFRDGSQLLRGQFNGEDRWGPSDGGDQGHVF